MFRLFVGDCFLFILLSVWVFTFLSVICAAILFIASGRFAIVFGVVLLVAVFVGCIGSLLLCTIAVFWCAVLLWLCCKKKFLHLDTVIKQRSKMSDRGWVTICTKTLFGFKDIACRRCDASMNCFRFYWHKSRFFMGTLQKYRCVHYLMYSNAAKLHSPSVSSTCNLIGWKEISTMSSYRYSFYNRCFISKLILLWTVAFVMIFRSFFIVCDRLNRGKTYFSLTVLLRFGAGLLACGTFPCGWGASETRPGLLVTVAMVTIATAGAAARFFLRSGTRDNACVINALFSGEGADFLWLSV